jgi:hypothetical protein
VRLGVDPYRWARALTSAGWASVLAYLALMAVAINRARLTDDAGFSDGVWGQRLEVLSFVSFPQQLMVLVPAVAAAVAAVFLGADAVETVEPWHQRLVRVTAGAAFVAIALALADVVSIVVRGDDSVGDFGDVVQRVGGIALAWGIVRVCLEIERMNDQPPRSPVR